MKDASELELIALFGALAHPDVPAIGTHFSAMAVKMAKRIEDKVGELQPSPGA